MAENTAIEWCTHSWSPWEGCTKVSLAEHGGGGCDNCYAAARNGRFSRGANWGPGAPRRLTAEWTKPVLWNRKAAKSGERVTVFPSICDPFDNEVPREWRTRFYELVSSTPYLTWLLLTKRIGNVRAMAEHGPFTTLPNVWLGITAVNQQELDRDAGKLLALPAPVHFLSYEPALGPIDASRWLKPQCDKGSVPAPDGTGGVTCPLCLGVGGCSGISWVIAGGESGPHARPMHPEWVRSLRDQCAAAGVPFLFKQHGEWLATAFCDDAMAMLPSRRTVYVSRGGSFVPLGQAVDFFGGAEETAWVGKKAAGRLLDGVTHDQFPEVGKC